ncbi:hypothetical protein [Sphingobacterium sp. UBA5980]|uniref:hypothetical protein n=1 Tax=Sphingobacterium sp. UBA5980 TaxID=1947504 RepID=UPI0025798175|nr:hypothetical protein [Sphingobacterium sp. UBA5980]
MSPFKYELQELSEINTPFYTRIGLLSVRFSEIESLITHIIEKLINSDDELINHFLIKENSLHVNLELIKKLSSFRHYEEERISEIVSKLKPLQRLRNSFIHGVWLDVTIENNETCIYCSDHIWQLTKSSSNRIQYSRYDSKRYTTRDLDKELITASEILLELKRLWQDIDEVNYF